MFLFFKYIGFIFLCFNIFAVHAAEVTLQVDNPDEIYITENIPARLDLPHPVMMREILHSDANNTLANIILLVKYFDERYPEDKIHNDFSSDVALIFPELSPQEVYNRTSYIRNAVRLYRWGNTKYTEIKEKLLAPPPPPLILNEEDYDFGKTPEYTQAPENQFAIMYDFKKVLGYGDDPRDIKAREAYKQNLLDKKKNKTGFEKFQSMVSKLEFSKIPFYGITLPNPFVGNAGTGSWVKKDDFQARLLADYAEISNLSQIRAAIHIAVPSSRFMLATDLDNARHKPRIELFDTHNIKSYQIHYPLPVTAANEQLIGGYTGDFAIPLTIQTLFPDKEVSFKARIVFQNCDRRFECRQVELTPQISIAQGPENTVSGFENFIKQSLYNIPASHSENFTLEQCKPIVSSDGKEVREIHCIFDFSGHISKFSLFIEDNQHTRFSAPKIAVNNSKIYATIIPLDNQLSLLNEEFTISARLNILTTLRKKIILKEQTDLPKQRAILTLMLWCLVIGVLLNISPLVVPIYGLKLCVPTKRSKNNLISYNSSVFGIFTACNFAAAATIILQSFNIFFVWKALYVSPLYLSTVFLILFALFSTRHDAQPLFPLSPRISGFARGLATSVVAPLSLFFFSPHSLATLEHTTWYVLLACFNLMAAGMSLPYLMQMTRFSFIKSTLVVIKLKYLIYSLSLYLLSASILWLSGMIVSLVTIPLWKIVLGLLLVWGIFSYLLDFLRSLTHTRLPKRQKKITEYVIAGIFIVVMLGYSCIMAGHKLPDISPSLPSAEELKKAVRQGKNILISLQSPNCFTCKINNFVTFNTRNLAQWKERYALEYISLNFTQYTPELEAYFTKYQKTTPPLYVLYNHYLEDGVVLPSVPSDTDIAEILDNFDI